MKLSNLKPNEGQIEGVPSNPRTITEDDFEKLKKSLVNFRKMLSLRPMVVDEDWNILGGNMRYQALCRLRDEGVDGFTDDIPDEWVKQDTTLSAAEKREFVIKDNQQRGRNDWDALANEWDDEELREWDVEAAEWSADESEDDSKHVDEDDFDEDKDKVETICKQGDIWRLGAHRLMCGDSTDKTTIELLMNGEKADLVLTDPPYGMKKEKDGVLNDNLNYDDLLEFNKQWIPNSFDALKENGSWYCWGIDEPLMDIYSHIIKPMTKKNGKDKTTLKNYITWDKGSGFGQMSSLQRSYTIATEKCLFVMRGRQDYGETKEDYWDGFEPLREKFDEERKKTGLSTDELCKLAGATSITHWWSVSQWNFPNKERYEALQKALRGGEYDGFRDEYDKIRDEYDKIRDEWYKTRAYFDNTHDNMNDVWHFNVTSKKERELCGGHATPKPIALCSRAIKSSSRDGESVLDMFGGSGSTLIACEQLNRRCYMIELDPHYCDVIIARWEKLTGEKAVLINRGANE